MNRPLRVLIAKPQILGVPLPDSQIISRIGSSLRAAGVETDVARLPVIPTGATALITQVAAFRLMDLEQSYGLPIDACLAVDFPAIHLRHPRKIALIRQLWPWWNVPPYWSAKADDSMSAAETGMLRDLDRAALDQCWRWVVADSGTAPRLADTAPSAIEPLAVDAVSDRQITDLTQEIITELETQP